MIIIIMIMIMAIVIIILIIIIIRIRIRIRKLMVLVLPINNLPTTIVWKSPMRELISSVMVSSLLLPAFGTLSLPLYFQLPSTFLPSQGRSTTTLGTRWHDFFISLFRYFMNQFYYFHCLSFPFLEGCRLEKGHIVPILCSHS